MTPGLQASAAVPSAFALRISSIFKFTRDRRSAAPGLSGRAHSRAGAGTFESTLQTLGDDARTRLLGRFRRYDVEAYGLSIASAFGEVRLRGTTLVLSDAGASFTRAKPRSPARSRSSSRRCAWGPGPTDRLRPRRTDLDPALLFDGMLGDNTKFGGTINGHVGISGTIGSPEIRGQASLIDGSYASDLERTPIKGAAATLTFNRDSASISRLFARVGSGRSTAAGASIFRTASRSSDLAFDVAGRAHGAQLDLPAYGKGTLDAAVRFKKAAQADRALLGQRRSYERDAALFGLPPAATGRQSGGGPPLPLAFDLSATAGKNVRVRGSGYGAGLDIGATG